MQERLDAAQIAVVDGCAEQVELRRSGLQLAPPVLAAGDGGKVTLAQMAIEERLGHEGIGAAQGLDGGPFHLRAMIVEPWRDGVDGGRPERAERRARRPAHLARRVGEATGEALDPVGCRHRGAAPARRGPDRRVGVVHR